MINILPQRGLAGLKFAYRVRLAAVVLLAGAAALIAATALLIPAYLDARVLADAARAEKSRIDALNSESAEAEAPLIAAGERLEAYAPLLFSTSASDGIAPVLAARPQGVMLRQIRYEQGSRSVRVSGVASTREALLAFERALRVQAAIESVTLPVGDLARSSQAPFSLTVVLKEAAL